MFLFISLLAQLDFNGILKVAWHNLKLIVVASKTVQVNLCYDSTVLVSDYNLIKFLAIIHY